MDDNGESIKNRIIELLNKQPEGITITELAGMLKLHRQTTTKYLFELKGANMIRTREVGPAKLLYINGEGEHK